MTTPTQAQIEAAANALKEIFGDVLNDNKIADQTLAIAAETALTAAAQIRETPIEHLARDIREGRFPQKSEVMSAWDDRFSGSAKEIEAHTIERCAQVADDMEISAPSAERHNLVCQKIAAAIRKLKREQ